ncbi:hypothetical protein [Pararhodonellum marinum]|uniref:hypothetical protein n=1 Tax=Pararhodonellum marinum TaxID=2755358 RepID=UPI0018903FFA|nr:hypothetical protein [Pararhodonellum marinum]
MFQKIAPRLLPILLLLSCVAEDNIPTGSQLMLNPNLSLYPDSVFPWTAHSTGEIEAGVSHEIFFTGNRSLFIDNQDSLAFGSGSWSQTYTGPMPVTGSSLELTAFVKGENIRYLSTGYIGISISLQPFQEHSPGIRSAHSGKIEFLEGDFDWTPIRLTLENFPEEVDGISVNLGLGFRTVGKVYFDEITLDVK